MSEKKRRRRWSEIEKEKIVLEAETFGFSNTARKMGLTTSLLFSFRQQLFGSKEKAVTQPLDEIITTRKSLGKIERLDDQVDRISTKLLADLESRTISAYNAAVGYSSLAGALDKLTTLRHKTEDRLKSLIIASAQNEAEEVIDNEYDLEMRRVAEQCLLRLVTDHILPQQQPAEDVN